MSSNFQTILPGKKVFSATPEQIQFFDEAIQLLNTTSVNYDIGADITSYFSYLQCRIFNINSLNCSDSRHAQASNIYRRDGYVNTVLKIILDKLGEGVVCKNNTLDVLQFI